MKRIGILTAGGDTPALNATVSGAVVQANRRRVEVYGFITGYSALLNPAVPHVHLNPLFTETPELDPTRGGTVIGASRAFVDPEDRETIAQIAGIAVPGAAADPLAVFIERGAEKYPGVVRDIFKMTDQAPVAKKIVTQPVVTVVSQPVSTVPVNTAEEIAADMARTDLSKFRFLGYLTDKDSSLFLSKEGELFIVKKGDTVLKSYQIKAAGMDHVVLYDTVTKVEVRSELSGGAGK